MLLRLRLLPRAPRHEAVHPLPRHVHASPLDILRRSLVDHTLTLALARVVSYTARGGARGTGAARVQPLGYGGQVGYLGKVKLVLQCSPRGLAAGIQFALAAAFAAMAAAAIAIGGCAPLLLLAHAAAAAVSAAGARRGRGLEVDGQLHRRGRGWRRLRLVEGEELGVGRDGHVFLQIFEEPLERGSKGVRREYVAAGGLHGAWAGIGYEAVEVLSMLSWLCLLLGDRQSDVNWLSTRPMS